MRDTDTIEDAAALLTGHTITTAPVLDGTGTPVGIVSDADLLSGVECPGTERAP